MAIDLKFIDDKVTQAIIEVATTVAKLINGFIGVLDIDPTRGLADSLIYAKHKLTR